jgi:uncharacterized protein YukJ
MHESLKTLATACGMWKDDKGVWHGTDGAIQKFADKLCNAQLAFIGESLQSVVNAITSPLKGSEDGNRSSIPEA